MKRITPILIATALAAIGAAQSDPAHNDGSLYGSKSQSIIAARTAMAKGDIVTIIISEQSAAQFTASTATTKKDSNVVDKTNSSILNWLNIPLTKAIFGGGSSGANSSVSGSGTTSGATNFSARISAIVKDVLPNGNLVLEGTRDLKLNKESHQIVMSGIVRRDDVRPDNTVLSENMAMAEIRSLGTGGQIADRQRRGILTRIMDFLF